MARFVVGASLKAYFGRERTMTWARAVDELSRAHPAVRSGAVEPFAVPGFLSIAEVAAVAADGPLRVGAQDAHWDDGAFTGEVSPRQLAEFGVSLVEVGHAERRRHFGETDETVARKTDAILAAGLTPLVCVGEESEGSPQDAARAAVRQLQASLARALAAGRDGRVLVAYEPVWAIGAPEPAPDEHIRVVCAELRAALRAMGMAVDSAVLYGGSAGPGLLSRIGAAVDGLFLGRFAHDPEAFGRILDEAGSLAQSDGVRRPGTE
ncbi:triose-phosphate isomerase family protein [Microbacterium sp. JZ37]|uniref:triose-phosphate isomerase family protein n=1 Tax=Microbacterium sp. JZ37 TaxID=2654193 RepID=UPI002B46F986|nr:triose-phosphate isomerase family protein [Microbacterium sp. JZ37]WRH18669.1 triosephosphate isomerase [Microbacterium sp. JZ37]